MSLWQKTACRHSEAKDSDEEGLGDKGSGDEGLQTMVVMKYKVYEGTEHASFVLQTNCVQPDLTLSIQSETHNRQPTLQE